MVLANSGDSAMVSGMPAELIKGGRASFILPSDKIAAQIQIWAGD